MKVYILVTAFLCLPRVLGGGHQQHLIGLPKRGRPSGPRRPTKLMLFKDFSLQLCRKWRFQMEFGQEMES